MWTSHIKALGRPQLSITYRCKTTTEGAHVIFFIVINPVITVTVGASMPDPIRVVVLVLVSIPSLVFSLTEMTEDST